MVEVFNYLVYHQLPAYRDKEQKKNFKKQCQPYQLVDGKLMYAKNVTNNITGSNSVQLFEVLKTKEEQQEMIQFVHEGGALGDVSSSSSHRSKHTTSEVLSKYYFWNGILLDCLLFINTCLSCKQRNEENIDYCN